jgi:hypothetical protein
MGLTIKVAESASRVTRKTITSGKSRSLTPLSTQVIKNKNGGILGYLWNGLTGFIGSLFTGVFQTLVSGIQWSFTALWSGLIAAKQFIWNFNWNVTDAELDKTMSTAFDNLGNALGGFLGSAAGYLVCGALPGATIMVFNEALGLHILEKVGEEALDELTSSMATLIRSTFTSIANASVAFLYKNIRSLWRESDSAFKERLKKKGLKGDDLDKALAERNKPFTFAKGLETNVNNINNEFLKNFAEEFIEEFDESCVEAGYVVANSLDVFHTQQAGIAQEQTFEIEFGDNKTTIKEIKSPSVS